MSSLFEIFTANISRLPCPSDFLPTSLDNTFQFSLRGPLFHLISKWWNNMQLGCRPAYISRWLHMIQWLKIHPFASDSKLISPALALLNSRLHTCSMAFLSLPLDMMSNRFTKFFNFPLICSFSLPLYLSRKNTGRYLSRQI